MASPTSSKSTVITTRSSRTTASTHGASLPPTSVVQPIVSSFSQTCQNFMHAAKLWAMLIKKGSASAKTIDKV